MESNKSGNALEIRNLHKAYGSKQVLQGLDMSVPEGSIYAFLGRNGEGKTTTMKLILQILEADSGSISVLGENALDPSGRAKLRVGYVPETPFFYEWMRVREILDFVRGCYGGLWDASKSKALLGQFSIDPESLFGRLSLGLKAKVALVAALSHNPELLLLDDPTSGLDVVVRREFLESLVELVDSSRCTVVFSTHLLSEVERIADRVALLQEGKLLFEKETEKLKEVTKRVVVRFREEPPQGVFEEYREKLLYLKREGREIELRFSELDSEILSSLRREERFEVSVHDMDLEEIFVSYTRNTGNRS